MSQLRLSSSEFISKLYCQFKNQAISNGVSASTYDRYTQNLAPDYSVIEKLNYQPEFSTPIWDYLSGLVDDDVLQWVSKIGAASLKC